MCERKMVILKCTRTRGACHGEVWEVRCCVFGGVWPSPGVFTPAETCGALVILGCQVTCEVAFTSMNKGRKTSEGQHQGKKPYTFQFEVYVLGSWQKEWYKRLKLQFYYIKIARRNVWQKVDSQVSYYHLIAEDFMLCVSWLLFATIAWKSPWEKRHNTDGDLVWGELL